MTPGAMTPEPEACGTCRFFRPDEKQAARLRLVEHPSQSNREEIQGVCRSIPPLDDCWPKVGEGDWCGGFRRVGEDDAIATLTPMLFHLQAGDVLWVSTRELLGPDARARLQEQIQGLLLPGTKVVIAEEGIEPLAVLRSEAHGEGPDGLHNDLLAEPLAVLRAKADREAIR